MGRRRRSRLYWREGRGWYADLRDFADVGGRREAMIPTGGDGATVDADEAGNILQARLDELKALRAGRGEGKDPLLEEYARYHLRTKGEYRRESTVDRDERALRRVIEFFGPEVRLSDIDVPALTAYVSARRRQPGVREGTRIASQTILHELHALSSLFKRAIAEGRAELNPVSRLPQKPQVEREEAEYLEVGQAARLLKAAAELDAGRAGRRVRFLHPLLAAFLLTGGRAQEVLGLLREDVDLVNGQVHFRANRHRTLKRPRHRRWIPLWPQLREILTPHLETRREGALVFPSTHGGMIKDMRSALTSAVKRAKIEKIVTPHTFRHTYAATRLQTMDHGQPVSPYTVMRELGHSSLSLIEKTYGHLMEVRVRSAVVEYREVKVVPFRQRVDGK